VRSEIVSQEKNIVKIKVEVPEGEFRESMEKAISELRQKAEIKGFRKGKVPKNILEMRLGKDTIKSEALEKLLPKTLDTLIEEYELELIDTPKVDIETLEEDKPVLMTVTFETRPEVELGAPAALEVEKRIVEITGDMVDEAIDQLRETFAERKPVEGRPAGPQDIVHVQYAVKVDSEEETGEKQEPVKADIDLSADNVREEFREALLGKNVGETAVVEIPKENIEDAEKPSETVRFDLEILSIEEKQLPEIGPELYSRVFGEDVNTEEEFREKVREALKSRFEAESIEGCRQEAISKLCDASNVEVPDKLIERQVEEIKREEEQRIQQQTGKSREEYFNEIGIDLSEHENEIRKRAENMVKRSLVLQSYAEREKIQVAQKDLMEEINALAQSIGAETEKVQQFLANDRKRLEEVFGRVRYKKTIDRLVESVKVNEKPLVKETGTGAEEVNTEDVNNKDAKNKEDDA